jgi:hypothetical protein
MALDFRYFQQETSFSLGPDGHRLAILDHGVLTISELE